MKEELLQSVASAATDHPVAMSASGGGLVVGTMTAFNYFNAITGAFTVVASIALLLVLITKGYYNIQLARAQLKELELCNQERGTVETRRSDK